MTRARAFFWAATTLVLLTPVVSAVAWDDLRASLGGASELVVPDDPKAAWLEQCVPLFAKESFNLNAPLSNGSNYELYQQPDYLCADIFSCAWKGCDWAPQSLAEIFSQDFPTSLEDYFDPDAVSDEQWNLPSAVLLPETAADVVAAIRFATDKNMGLSVKTSGHNYMGASTDKNSLSINMRKYPKYASEVEGSLLECDSIVTVDLTDPSVTASTDDLRQWACGVAMSRNWSAILRVGGGEIWDEVYRSVSDFNQAADTPKYHIVGGGAGTVGAAGGYLGGTGLSGTTGMRVFGFAVDQVTQMEMVLPTGHHVRFGPTEWTEDEWLHFPRTTKVTGWCNENVVLDESQWQWKVCDESEVLGGEVTFDDLWHAVRGGGNGYGVVTSVEYQLPDYPGDYSMLMQVIPQEFAEAAPAACGECLEAGGLIEDAWINYMIDITWNPSALNVSADDSIMCGGPGGASLSTTFWNFYTVGPSISFCFGNGGQVWADAWSRVVLSMQQDLLNANYTQAMVDMIAGALVPSVSGTFLDYPSFLLSNPTPVGVPEGRLPDNPRPFTTYTFSMSSVMVPVDFLVENREASIPWLRAYTGGQYLTGGRVNRYHDGTAATSAQYRQSGFYADITLFGEFNTLLLQSLFQYWFGDGTPDEENGFPGGGEFNHYQNSVWGPLRSNWTVPCPLDSADSTKCIGLMEFIFGTKGLERLEKIKAAVDPHHLFNCYGCIGYRADFQRVPNDEGDDSATSTNGDHDDGDDTDAGDGSDTTSTNGDSTTDGDDAQTASPPSTSSAADSAIRSSLLLVTLGVSWWLD